MPIIQAYHGTNQEFEQFSQDKAKIANDYYGGGVAYFTPNLMTARTYAKSAARKFGGHEIIYRVQLNLKKVFDVDQEYSGKELKTLMGHNFEQFARSSGLLSIGVDRYAIMADLKEGNVVLTGAQIFRGLSNGMINTAKAREHLKRLKYDALRYNPVTHAQRTPHEVFIVYDARNIHITGKYGADYSDE